MPSTFISYRREDTAWCAGRLSDGLEAVLGPDTVFRDVHSLERGVQFEQQIMQAIGDAQVVLVLVGPNWAGAEASSSRRRIDDPDDFVRMEVAQAITLGKRIIPILVDDAALPREGDLPDDIAALVKHEGIEVRYKDFHHNVADLAASLRKTVRRPLPVRLRPFASSAVMFLLAAAVAYLGYLLGGFASNPAEEVLTAARVESYQQAKREFLNTIVGVVADADGRTPIDGATVTARSSNHPMTQTQTTTDGDYTLDISDWKLGLTDRVVVTVSANERTDNISFSYGKSLRHRFALKR